MPTSKTAPSTPRLSEVARHVVIPEGIVTTAWTRVEAKCAEMGVTFDVWQQGIGAAALGKRRDGKYAATVGGVVLSIPRQVGKTFLVGMIVIALCVLFPGYTVLWTAHRTRTATKTFQSMKGLTSRKKIKPHMLDPRNTNGEQEIRFRNGSVIMFGAREQGFGRGFDEVDVEVFDEAQILSEKALEDMVPAANQSRHESGALLFFMGTPPRPSDPGQEFANRRTKALSGKTTDLMYVEFSSDVGANLDDRKQWARANPSFPRRTPVESMLRMRENLTDDDSFLREALGVWDDGTGAAAFGAGNWDACRNDGRPQGARVGGLAIGVSYDQTFATISAAGRHDGVVHVKPVEHHPGTAWVVERAALLQGVFGVQVAVDGSGPASFLIPDLQAAGVDLFVMETRDVLDACAWIHSAVAGESKTLGHSGYKELDESVAGASKRTVGDRWAWGRKTSKANLSPLESVTFAGYLASQRPDIKHQAVSPELLTDDGGADFDGPNLATVGF